MQSLTDALHALWVIKVFQAQTGQPEPKVTTWAFVVTGDKTCEECQKYKDDTYELENPDDLLGMFDYGEWIDEDTFAPKIHPNYECAIIKVDMDFTLVSRVFYGVPQKRCDFCGSLSD